MRAIALLAALVACGGKDPDTGTDTDTTDTDTTDTDTTDTDTTDTTDTDTTDTTDTDPTLTTPTGGDCAFVGTWTLQSYACGPTDITAQWMTLIPSTTLVITDRAGGGCDVVSTYQSPSCKEVEDIVFTDAGAPAYEMDFQGIASCDPAGCSFGGDDAPCMVGDRVEVADGQIALEGANLRVTFDGAQDVCGPQPSSLLYHP